MLISSLSRLLFRRDTVSECLHEKECCELYQKAVRLSSAIPKPLRYPEQDLLNTTFVGKIKTLPLKYNLAPGIGVPSHFTQEEAAEINSGKHVIVNCYYSNIKAYDKTTANQVVYGMFEKCSKNIGMSPEMFMETYKNPIPVKDSFIPHIKIRGQNIIFFGMDIK